ncbi:MAG: DivIVA domain-containing protein [Candidatus Eremiobacteraeota bacterium]|nr:DivIVA domain-containing protein [Candidatus Eremiobacteraeota bacterium]
MQKITPIDIQHKTFKKALQGYDRAEVDQFLDEVIETLEDDAQKCAALEVEIADLKERISHFKAMEESLHNTLVLAQRTADEVKASAHKEADLIKEQARLASEREISTFTDAAAEARRESQRATESAEKAKNELRGLLMTHLSMLEKTPPNFAPAAPQNGTSAASGSSAPTGDTEAVEVPPQPERITVY